jgi:hypothetical protein
LATPRRSFCLTVTGSCSFSAVVQTGRIYFGALDANTPTRLTSAGCGGVLLPSGWLLWARAGTQTLVAQRLDAGNAPLTGELVTVADGVAADLATAVSVAASGLVAYRTGTGGQRQLTWFDRAGTAQGTIGDPDATLSNPRVSPDGRRVVVERRAAGQHGPLAAGRHAHPPVHV